MTGDAKIKSWHDGWGGCRLRGHDSWGRAGWGVRAVMLGNAPAAHSVQELAGAAFGLSSDLAFSLSLARSVPSATGLAPFWFSAI
jgi:hypothetical protein